MVHDCYSLLTIAANYHILCTMAYPDELPTPVDYGDLPRDELMAQATEALAKTPGSVVNFKFTCENCGERCILSEPNKLYESGECCTCGHTTKIDKGGFMLTLKLSERDDKR